MDMSESRPEKRKVEMIESYWTGGEYGSDYVWNDNHGELIRCRDCKHYRYYGLTEDIISECTINNYENQPGDWFCADGKKRPDL